MNLDVPTPPAPCPSVADTPAKRIQWWANLEPQWQTAFGLAFFGHLDPPIPEELEALWQTPVLRLAGPQAPYPNVTAELTNCSGVVGMSNLEILVLTNHQIERLDEMGNLPKLKSLFINNNGLRCLRGIETLTQLEQLHAQGNRIESIEPIRSLVKLREVYVGLNALISLDGLTHQHTAIKGFFCLPNDGLTDRVIMQTERRLGIRCRSL